MTTRMKAKALKAHLHPFFSTRVTFEISICIEKPDAGHQTNAWTDECGEDSGSCVYIPTDISNLQ